MRTVFLTRGDQKVRKPIVFQLESILNPDVNNIKAHTLSFNEDQFDIKAAHSSLKKEFKLAIKSSNKHIIVDAACPGVQSWTGFASALEDTGIFVIGLDCTDDKIHFKPPGGFIMYQKVRAENISDILLKHRLT